jgi:predicted secreted protein
MLTHRSPRILVAVAAVIVTAMTALGATPAQAAAPAKKNITLTVTELPAQVRLVVGEAVNVRLSTNVTTGYSWSTKVVGDTSAVAVSKGVYAAPASDSGIVGAPGTTTWTVTAKAKGTAVVKFYATPPGGGKKTLDGSLTVIVK